MTDFGRDLHALDHLVPGRMASGLLLVAQAAYHRLKTPTGTLADPEEEDYGRDLVGLVGSLVEDSDTAAWPAIIHEQLTRDERILDVETTVTPSGSNVDRTWTFEISCQTDAGPFSLVLAVNSVTVELLGLST